MRSSEDDRSSREQGREGGRAGKRGGEEGRRTCPPLRRSAVLPACHVVGRSDWSMRGGLGRAPLLLPPLSRRPPAVGGCAGAERVKKDGGEEEQTKYVHEKNYKICEGLIAFACCLGVGRPCISHCP